MSRGFTLAEALIASVFLAVCALGVAGSLTAASQSSANLTRATNCQALARELLEEAGSRSFTTRPNPGWASGGLNRSNFDDVADYDTYTDSTSDTNGIKTLQGTTVSFGDGASYTRSVTFRYRATPTGANAASGDFGLLTVTVTSSSGTSVTLQRLLSYNSMIKR